MSGPFVPALGVQGRTVEALHFLQARFDQRLFVDGASVIEFQGKRRFQAWRSGRTPEPGLIEVEPIPVEIGLPDQARAWQYAAPVRQGLGAIKRKHAKRYGDQAFPERERPGHEGVTRLSREPL
ncbi:hypothetical protein [Pseudomonas sp. S1_A06]